MSTIKPARFSRPLLALPLALSTAIAAPQGFEIDEGANPGAAISTLSGWKSALEDSAVVSESAAHTGQQSLEIKRSTKEIAIARPFKSPADGITFLDFAILPSADPSAEPSYIIDAAGARLAFAATSPGTGTIYAAPGGKPVSVETGSSFALDENGRADEWLRITIRRDAKAGTWDLFLDGRLALIDQPLAKSPSELALYPSPAGSAWIDDLTIASTNPLFPDADKDGIPDAVEKIEGTNPIGEDRQTTVKSNGKSNLRNFLANSSLSSSQSAKIAGRRVIYVDGLHGDDHFSGCQSYRLGISGKSEDGPKATLAAAIRATDDQVAIALLPSDKSYVLIERDPGSESIINLIPLGDVNITTTEDKKP